MTDRHSGLSSCDVCEGYDHVVVMLATVSIMNAQDAAGTSIVVRDAQDADLERLLELYHQLYPEYEVTNAAAAAAAWSAVTATPGRRVHVAQVDGVVAGTADLTVMANLAHRGQPYLLVENLVVDSAHRRRGVGAALLAAAAEHARVSGCYKLQLSADDAAAFRFYEAVGLQNTARTYKRYLNE